MMSEQNREQQTQEPCATVIGKYRPDMPMFVIEPGKGVDIAIGDKLYITPPNQQAAIDNPLEELQVKLNELNKLCLYHEKFESELQSKLDAANETIEEQRRRLEVLYDGTEGSTPALVKIARLESELDAANARIAELEGKIWDNAKKFTEVYAENIALKRPYKGISDERTTEDH